MAFTPANLIARARRLYNVSVDQWSAEDALSDLNELKNNFLATLINSVEDGINFETWLASTVALQGEYSLPAIGAATAGAKQIKRVSVAYSSETYETTGKLKFVPATEVNPNSLPNHWSYYEENQPKESPMYFCADDSLFIAPVPRSGEA